MRLYFHSREDLLVNQPGKAAITGQSVKYVGRKFVPAKKDAAGNVVAASARPATEDPYGVDANTPEAQSLAKQCRRGVLFAADKATAEYCQVGFVEIEFRDGAWVEASAPVVAAAPKRAAVSKGSKESA